MSETFTYITSLSLFIILPTLIIVFKNLKTIVKYKLVILSSFIVFPSSFLWDYFSIIDNVWYFQNILGLWILGLPVEEILFISFLIILVSSTTMIIIKSKRWYAIWKFHIFIVYSSIQLVASFIVANQI